MAGDLDDSDLQSQAQTEVREPVFAGVTRAPVAEKALSRLSGVQRDKEKIKVVLNRRVFAIPQSIYRKL